MASSNHARKAKRERQHRMSSPGEEDKPVTVRKGKRGRRSARPIKYR